MFGKNYNVRFSPDLVFVARQSKRMKNYPRLGQIATKAIENKSFAIGAIFWYVRYQNGQFNPPELLSK